jgi:hypothetical protein
MVAIPYEWDAWLSYCKPAAQFFPDLAAPQFIEPYVIS